MRKLVVVEVEKLVVMEELSSVISGKPVVHAYTYLAYLLIGGGYLERLNHLFLIDDRGGLESPKADSIEMRKLVSKEDQTADIVSF